MSEEQILILDGGMGRELERIGAPFSQPLWSAQALIEAPEMVAHVHRSFIQSGAQVITTNSYAVVPAHVGTDIFEEKGRALVRSAAQLARKEADDARIKDGRNVLVAACVPPVFGSYRPGCFDQNMAPSLLSIFFEEQEHEADIFLAETISSLEEARAIQDVYKNFGSTKPLWLAFTLKELFDNTTPPKLRSDEPLENVLKDILESGVTEAIFFNCCSVEDVSAAFDHCTDLIKKTKTVKIGAYANAFGRVKGKRSPTNNLSVLREDISPERYFEYAKNWQSKGASIIGGCCGIGPEYISLLSEKFCTLT